MINDQDVRSLALDPNKSFIVQAPAGSGKTTLLVTRYLNLLKNAKNPEEILAITFTKKAASEMRSRIITALKTAESQLAQEVLKQNQIKEWHLLENHHRLRIQTIDAFCHYLIAQSPLATDQNQNAQIIQNQIAEIYYRKAAEDTLKSISDQDYSQYIETLLLYLNNDWERAIKLLITMLKSREQWLPHIMVLKNTQDQRKKMELELEIITQENIERVIKLFPKDLHQEISIILQEAQDIHKTTPIFFAEFTAFKTLTTINVSTLKNLGSLLLTKEFTWRRKITKTHGFPAVNPKDTKDKQQRSKLLKQRMEELLTKFSAQEHLRQSLENLLLSPPLNYQDESWKIITTLLKLLPLLAAHFKLICAEDNVTDHTEIAMTALQLLGHSESPSDLALNLDYKIQHLLVDEFQDTSVFQYRLIETLISGWQNNDGHTLFLVGDPMQSIYRFREAEVGLFLRTQLEGIGNLKLNPVVLTTNFRSAQNIVTWINKNFAHILPTIPDITLGGVPFRESCAILDNQNAQVALTLFRNGSANDEAQEAIHKIKEIRSYDQNGTIAILVKARSHLNSIIPALRQENLPYQAFELSSLQTNLVVRDLFSLTKALLDPADKVSWIAILRAPWCGLTLNDLHQIAHGSNLLIWDIINAISTLNLSDDGKKRLTKFIELLKPFFDQRNRLPLPELIKKSWLALGGPATAAGEEELEYAELYLELLNNNDELDKIAQKLNDLFLPTNNLNAKIIIMTIHKAKGLEFDHVIVPNINRATKANEYKLLLWHDRPKLHSGSGLILAPISSFDNNDQVYNYLRQVEQKRSYYETGRILYVAITRAKHSASLIGSIKDDKTIAQRGSLLEQLEPVLPNISVEYKDSNTRNIIPTNVTEPKLIRLTRSWVSPIIITTQPNNNLPQLNIQDNQPAIIGTVIHYLLAKINLADLSANNSYHHLHSYWTKLLRQFGYIDLSAGIKLIEKALSTISTDSRGRWILKDHEQAANELELITIFANQPVKLVIDRTFIDQDGIRWIIDYKTSTPNQKEAEKFLATELNNYSDQLIRYHSAIKKFDPDRQIKMGLYFPLFGGWIEIAHE